MEQLQRKDNSIGSPLSELLPILLKCEMTQIVEAIFNMVGSENRDQMPKEDNTPEKRVDRIFDLMDKVRSMTSSGTESHRISFELAFTKYICSSFSQQIIYL